jgi:hypothetical protein
MGFFRNRNAGGAMNVRSVSQLVVVLSASAIACSSAAQSLPIVNDLILAPQLGVVSGVVTGTSVDSWSELQNFTYVPLVPGSTATFYYQPTWDALTQTFWWDRTGSTFGTYIWEVVGINAYGSDAGLISVEFRNTSSFPFPEINDLEFQVQSPASNGGVVSGVVTATEAPEFWSGLLYPSYAPHGGGSGPLPPGIQTPDWNPATQEFGWNMAGAQPGLYTWHVHGSNHGGTNAAAITVRILVPEPNPLALLFIAIVTSMPGIRRPLHLLR